MNDRALYIGYPRTNCAINLIFSLFFSLSASVLVPLLKTNEFCVGNCYGCTARRRLFTFNGKVYKRKRMEKSPQLLLIGRRCETRRYYTIQCIAYIWTWRRLCVCEISQSSSWSLVICTMFHYSFLSSLFVFHNNFFYNGLFGLLLMPSLPDA